MKAPKHRVLLVEDEPHLAAGITLNLRLEGYAVTHAATARDASRELVKGEPFSLLILDVMLPDISGLEFCQHLREAGNRVPILMLTALGQSTDKVRGLAAGADDYLPKPFELNELLARVAAQVRRGEWATATVAAPASTTVFADYTLDLRARQVTQDGQKIPLTKLEFDLLALFATHPHHAFTRDELHRQVWGIEHSLSTRTVDNFVLRLRKRFEDDPTQPQHLLSIRGVGYTFDPSPGD